LLLYPAYSSDILCLHLGPMEAFAVSSALGAADSAPGKEGPACCHTHDRPDDGVFFAPVTHELFLSAVEALGGKVTAGELAAGQGEPVRGCLHLEVGGGALEKCLDCRPSDCIAIAVRASAPIIAGPEVLSRSQDLKTVMETLSEDMRTVVAAKILVLPGAEKLAAYLQSLLAEAWKAGKARAGGTPPASSGVTGGPAPAPRSASGGSPSPASAAPPKAQPAPRRQASVPALPHPGNGPAPASFSIPLNFQQAPAEAEPLHIQPVVLGHQQEEPDSAPQDIEAVVAPGQTIVLPSPKGDGKAPTIRISLVRQSPAASEKLDARLFPTSGVPGETLASLHISPDTLAAVNSVSTEEERWSTLLRMLAPETKVPM
jgi:hypothetical protein